MDNSILNTIMSFIAGSAGVEIVKSLYPELKQYVSQRRDSKLVFGENIGPILKASEELYGKLLSLSEEDFIPLYKNTNDTAAINNRRYVCYLFAQFWAQLEYIRIQNKHTYVSKTKKGRELLKFIATCESRKYRILDRYEQRIIGETMINGANQYFKIMSLHEFLSHFETPNSSINKWIILLEETLISSKDKQQKQRILRYGIIINALIEHFDPNHKIVYQRKSYSNKLSNNSYRILKYDLFQNFLPFIKNTERLIGKKKSIPPNIAIKR